MALPSPRSRSHHNNEGKFATPPPSQLSPRELQIVRLIALGKLSKEIASQFGVALKTVENERGRLYRKCHFRTLADVVRYAIKRGIIEL